MCGGKIFALYKKEYDPYRHRLSTAGPGRHDGIRQTRFVKSLRIGFFGLVCVTACYIRLTKRQKGRFLTIVID